MKKLTLLVTMMIASSNVFADGFVCQSVEGDLNVKIYNHTQPEVGTRVAAVMVLSDPLVQGGRKTIARFKQTSGTLSSEGAHYLADVDLRFTDSNTKGEYIAGTRLGHVDTIALDVDFSYDQPVAEGTLVKGLLTVTKRNGDIIEKDMECSRYLKR